MSLTNREIRELLSQKGVQKIYHANTVATSVTFLSNGGLLSRGAVEERGLFQTSQDSDDLDKEYGIWNDIFFDSVDIHARAKSVNQYGPVTFVYSVNLLDDLQEKAVKITKDNPIRWCEIPVEDRYFKDSTEMYFQYKKGNFGQHLTICDMHDPLPFAPHLRRIILDDPMISDSELFDRAKGKLSKLIEKMGLDVPLTIRECSSDCKCHEKYRNYKPGYIRHLFGLD